MTNNPFSSIYDLATSMIADEYISPVTMSTGLYGIEVSVYCDTEDALKEAREKIIAHINEEHAEYADKINVNIKFYEATDVRPEFYVLTFTYDF